MVWNMVAIVSRLNEFLPGKLRGGPLYKESRLKFSRPLGHLSTGELVKEPDASIIVPYG